MEKNPISLVSSILKLNKILLTDRKDISAIYMFAILGGLVQLSLPLGIQSIISFVMAGAISASIVVLICMVVFGVFANGLLQVRQLQIIEKVKQKLFFRYTMEYSHRIPRLNIEKLDNQYLPELVNRYFDSVTLQKGIDKLLLEIPGAVIQVILGIVLLSFYHPVFIVFGVLLISIVFAIVRFTSPKGLTTALNASTYKYALAGWLQEIGRIVKTFKYNNGASMQMQKTDKLVDSYLFSRTKHFKILLTQFWSLISFKIIITAAMLIIGSYLLVTQQINVGQFIAADIVIIAIIASIEKIITNLDAIYDSLVSVEKLSVIAEAETETGGSMLLSKTDDGVDIRFENVSFAYPNQKKVLNNLSFDVRRGEMVQLKGVSGSGKSSVLRLLTGAFKNFTGNVLIEGLPIGNYQLEELRRRTGILLGSQDIFEGSIWQNISMGNTSINARDVDTLAQITGLSEFVQSSPGGYDTALMPLGNKLPAGVRKNILLIRALIGKPSLLLLEDPFGHFDLEKKETVIRQIREFSRSTILISSQDDSIASLCDKVLTLNMAAGNNTL
ncbi:MAG: ABC transporter ATP-binding protein [Gemmatimonadaceae bacterium]|nr:ABC transporter ATP-binding protein [Chitinophagaceae bacterium]